MQGVDVRVVLLDVSPETAGQDTSQVAQGVVVQRGAAFVEVAHEDIVDWTAADVVVLDQVRGRSLPTPERGAKRDVGWGHSNYAEQVPGCVEAGDLLAAWAAMNTPGEYFQNVL